MNNKTEFYIAVKDLLDNPRIQDLKNYKHHNTNRLQHSIDVAYRGFVWAKKFGLDAKAVARAGVLHDFYTDYEVDHLTSTEHLNQHPQISLKNAKEITNISLVEEDIILSHMYGASQVRRPQTKEAWVICSSDKYCSVQEVTMLRKLKTKFVSTEFI